MLELEVYGKQRFRVLFRACCYALSYTLLGGALVHRASTNTPILGPVLAQATKKRTAAPKRKKAASKKKATARSAKGRVRSAKASSPRSAANHAANDSRLRAEDLLQQKAAITQMSRRLREATGLLFFFLGLVALLALVSFNQADPGWTHTGNGGSINNSMGRAGAIFSDAAFFLFGYMAYLVPFLCLGAGYLLFRDNRTKQLPAGYRPFAFLRIIGIVAMLLSASGLADLHFAVPEGSLPKGSFGGGILGSSTAWRLISFLSPFGTTIFLMFLFFASLTLAFGTSWLRVIEWVGAGIVGFIDKVANGFSTVGDKRSERMKVKEARRAREQRLQAEVAELEAYDEHIVDAPPKNPLAAALANAKERRAQNGAPGSKDFDRLDKNLDEFSDWPTGDLDAASDGLVRVTAETAPSPMQKAMKKMRGLLPFGDKKREAAKDALLDGLGANDGTKELSLAQRTKVAIEEQRTVPDTATTSASPQATASDANDPVAIAQAHAAAAQAAADAAASAAAALSAANGQIVEANATSATSSNANADSAATPVASSAAAATANTQTPSAGSAGAPRKKKIAIKERVPSADARQTKLTLDLPDSELPPLSLLDAPTPQSQGFSESELETLSRLLEEKLAEFRITVEVVAVQPGPVITRFEMQPAPGIKASRITNLSQDLARSLSIVSVRVVEVIPGKSTIGIEIPNDSREIVQLSEMIQAPAYAAKESVLTLALGKDISGQVVTADLGKMPHLLVAGTTGSGKSVGVNAMLLSLLYKATPNDVRMILIDPKMLELNVYDGIPHLLSPVVTDMSEAANALRWCVGEMERRYALMAELKVRNITGFNKKVAEAEANGTPIVDPMYEAEKSLDPTAAPPTLEHMPFIVVVVDEFADMMMQVGKKAEEMIARIAQKARAAGIHLILATQRPSVDVITGLIKANIPTRIAFQVSQKIDSRTILDQGGAESLLGHGDMLYLPPGTGLPMRVHGAFVDDHEVHNVVAHIKKTGEPNYIEEILNESQVHIPGLSGGGAEGGSGEQDALYDQAVAVVTESRRASISYVQRRLKIGYNRAATMIEEMEAAGVISPVGSNGTREVLAPPPV